MKMVEYQHRSEGGGNMVHLDNETWEHGESVLIVSKREFTELLSLAMLGIENGRPTSILRVMKKVMEQIKKL